MAIRAPHEKVGRIEVGQERLCADDIAGLLTLYGITDPVERRSLLALAVEANKPGWWHKYGDSLPAWFDGNAGLEEEASRIRAYGAHFVPALLQTEDYVRAMTALGHPWAKAREIEHRVSLRMRRQASLHGDDPPHFWAVVDEMALRRPVAGLPALRKQIKHLLDLTDLPHVTLQIVSFDRVGHSVTGPFSVLRFADPALPDVVRLDQLTSSLYLDRREDVDRYWEILERLCIEAEPAAAVQEDLARILRDL